MYRMYRLERYLVNLNWSMAKNHVPSYSFPDLSETNTHAILAPNEVTTNDKSDSSPQNIAYLQVHISPRVQTSLSISTTKSKSPYAIHSLPHPKPPTHNNNGINNRRPLNHGAPPPPKLFVSNPREPITTPLKRRRTRRTRSDRRLQLLQRSRRWQSPRAQLRRQTRDLRATGRDESDGRA